jgi:hypothetical protein
MRNAVSSVLQAKCSAVTSHPQITVKIFSVRPSKNAAQANAAGMCCRSQTDDTQPIAANQGK